MKKEYKTRKKNRYRGTFILKPYRLKKKFQVEFKAVFLEIRFCSKTLKKLKGHPPKQKSPLKSSELLERKEKEYYI